MKVRIISPALLELSEAAESYESKSVGVGDRFLRQVDRGIVEIERFPGSYKRITPRHHRYKLPNYPYELIYEIKETEIIICAVRDQRSDWGPWPEKLENR